MKNSVDQAASAEDHYWSLKLFELLQEMAAENTNPVLMVLAGVDRLQVERHYPEDGLLFAGRKWRAYYHCHETALIHPHEHGHFHLFTDIGNRAWAHVAGLSIDAQGQPLQWFTVNRWVTDGPWLETEVFAKQLKYISANDVEANPVARWLAIMLQLYRARLYDLLVERDRQIVPDIKAGVFADVLEDRDIYRLSTAEIELQSLLEKRLMRQPEVAGQGKKINNNEHK